MFPVCCVENCEYNEEMMCQACIDINFYQCEKCNFTSCDDHNNEDQKCHCNHWIFSMFKT